MLTRTDEKLIEFAENLKNSQEELEPEFEKVLSENYWDLLA